MKHVKIFFFLTFTITCLFTCKDDSEIDETIQYPAESGDNTGDSHFSIRVDGTAWPVDNYRARLIKAPIDGIDAKTFEIRIENAENHSITIVYTLIQEGDDGNCITEKIYFEEGERNYCEGASNLYTVCEGVDGRYFATPNDYVSDPFDEGGSSTITNCDPANETISGNFNLKLEEQFFGNGKATVEGTFRDISY